MYEATLFLFLIIVIALIALIMLQQGNGTDLGGLSCGTGVSSALFSSSGSANFLTRAIVLLATLFFIISLILGNINNIKTREWENISLSERIEPTISQLSTTSNTLNDDILN